MKALKYSRQRESIKTFLHGRSDHPTADAVYQGLRSSFPNISLGTVYRNLNLLVELGEIQRLNCWDGRDHFDWNPNPHYHFICRCCGSIQDLPMGFMLDMDALAQQYTDGKIENHYIYFRGICGGCGAAGRNEKNC